MTSDEIIKVMARERERQGISYKQLQIKSGVELHTVAKWVCGAARPRLDVLIDVLDALGLEIVLRRKNNGAEG